MAARPIRPLPDALIDQIAAGEVVERPASVVKELVENSLDAGASRVRVDVRDGGVSLIAVSDDGSGIPQGEIRLALSRHATSKLATPDDLLGIASFGFRGEALPAIASVSRLRLRTRQRGADEGWEVTVDGGRIVDEHAAGGPEGTRIEVADLFAAVPARRKFLKKPATEWGHIADWLGRLALALPEVHLEAWRDGSTAFVWPAAADPLDRIAAVLTERVARVLVPAQWEGSGGHLEAYLSGPEHTRANGNGLYLFVNGRPVRDTVMRHALLAAYRDLLPRGRFPTGVLFLTVDPGTVDVNVHPAKWEVRFSDPRAIHGMIRHCVRDAMSGRGWLGASAPAADPDVRSAPYPPPPTRSAPADRVAERPAAREPVTTDWVLAGAGVAAARGAEAVSGGAAGATSFERLAFTSLRVLGQVHASYILAEAKQGVVLVDQHAAHERVLYERLRAEWVDRGVSAQPLLLPETVEIDPLELAALVDAPEVAARLGFDVEPFGDAAVLVRAIPALLAGRDPATLVRGLAADLAAEPGSADGFDASDVRRVAAADRAFATLACHGARRFGDHLEPAEQRAILAALDEIPWAPTCPHGRPVAISLDLAEIERRFGRR